MAAGLMVTWLAAGVLLVGLAVMTWLAWDATPPPAFDRPGGGDWSSTSS